METIKGQIYMKIVMGQIYKKTEPIQNVTVEGI